ncbi:MAG TPA: hypothetical protein VGR06_19280 [Actinophytocola sp.]|jgi:hypothetical protein|nr:hypothetical protein [Actinophytocola sp.]
MASTIYLGDTSLFALQERHASVRQRFAALLTEGRLAACRMTALEYLNTAVNPKSYEALWSGLHGMRWMDVSTQAMDRALDVHRELGRTCQHRHFSLPDLIIAATAELNGANRAALRRQLRPDRQDHRPVDRVDRPARVPVDRTASDAHRHRACLTR